MVESTNSIKEQKKKVKREKNGRYFAMFFNCYEKIRL